MMDRKLNDILAGGYGVDSNFIDTKVRKLLMQLPQSSAMHVLSDFENALRTKRDEIRNPNAYLMGMISRTQSSIDIPIRGKVAARLDKLYRDGFCRPEDIDSRCIDLLKQITDEEGLKAIDELEKIERSKVKNVSAFFMGLMRRFLSKDDHQQNQNQNNSQFRGPRDLPLPPPIRDLSNLPPAPKILPSDLMFGRGDTEYTPRMPRSFIESFGFFPAVEDFLLSILEKRIIDEDELNDKTLQEIKANPENVGYNIVKAFSTIDRSSIRNISNYLYSIAKRLSVRPPNDHTGGISGGGGGSGGGGNYNNSSYNSGERGTYNSGSNYNSGSGSYPSGDRGSSYNSGSERGFNSNNDRGGGSFNNNNSYPSGGGGSVGNYGPVGSKRQMAPDYDQRPSNQGGQYRPRDDRPSNFHSSPPSGGYDPNDSYNSYPQSNYQPNQQNYNSRDRDRGDKDRDRGNNQYQSNNRDRLPDKVNDRDRFPSDRFPSQQDRFQSQDRIQDRRDDNYNRNQDSNYNRNNNNYNNPRFELPIVPSHEMSGRLRIDQEISRFVATGQVLHDDIDERVRDFLAGQRPSVAVKAINDFCTKDMSKIRDKSNFLKGIVRKNVEKELNPDLYPPHNNNNRQGGGYNNNNNYGMM